MEFSENRAIMLVIVGILCLAGQATAASIATGKTHAKHHVVPFETLLVEAAKNSTKQVPFFYNEANHVLRTEYDMLFKMETWQEMKNAKRQKRTAGIHPNQHQKRWANNIINYEINTSQFDYKDLTEINQAIADWSHYTCLSFRETSTRTNRIAIQNGDGCYSYVGMIGGAQELGLANGCRYKRIVIHELGHAIGLHHEQTRPDRDDHVTIRYENIDDTMEYNFELYDWDYIMDLDIPYDYHSIMHYSDTAFTNNGRVTIATKDPLYQDVIGEQEELSFRDIKTVNFMYDCKPESSCSLTNADCPGEGFVGKDCACWCPGKPVQYCFESDREEKGSLVRGCEDTSYNCPTYAREGYCTMYPSYMLTNCRLSCNQC